MDKERNIDIYVASLLKDIGIHFKAEESGIKEIDEALKTASKKGTGNHGYPEYIGVSKDFVIVIEDKADIDKHIIKEDDELYMDTKSITDYAINGAVHYAKHISKNTNFKRVFAIGISGNEKHHIIQPIYVDEENEKILKPIETLENFSEENIKDYYRESVLGETPKEQVELEEIIKLSKSLHEDLRNYGQLGETEKPLVVSAILLALEDPNFNIDSLIGDDIKTDGAKIFDALSNHMDRVKVTPDTKKQVILNQFNIITDRVKLNEKDSRLGKTPLRYFTEFLDNKVKHAIKQNSPEDVLGRFYGEFVKYGGGDGQSLGVVLTPRHITELFCELIDLRPDDIIFDPCCGTGGFLIAGMHYMIKQTDNGDEIEDIKRNKIYGMEIREDLFAIATTNMILRGDGKSNLRRTDFLEENVDELSKKKATVGFMNPPYSQAKGKDTQHLSELSFIKHLLDGLEVGGRAVVIVPQSSMIGKNANERKIKKQIYEEHTLESVITLNKNTFYGVGTNPCIAIFTAKIPHDKHKRCKFFNFEDDGFIVSKHVGLVETEEAKDKKKKLLDCYYDRVDAPSKFMVKTTVEPDDEWLHSFYYFNDEIPTEEDFKNTMADYLTFEFNMITHGRGYLFGVGDSIE